MFGIGWQELLIVLVIALIVFGRRLPEVGRSLGKGIVEFRKGLQGIEDEVKGNNQDPPAHEPPKIESTDADAPASTGKTTQSEQVRQANS